MKRSHEPWRVVFDDMISDGRPILQARGGILTKESTKAHLDRIVACVNFCRGIPNEILNRRNNEFGAHVSNTQVRIALRELGEQPA